jgi:hypothetical protein
MNQQPKDVFISYASEDRLDLALPLAKALEARGLDVWFDQQELALGDGLRSTIGTGLSQSRFAVVILSQNSLTKKWPTDEWAALMALEAAGGKRLLPITHNVSSRAVAEAFPLLADRLSIDSKLGIERLVEEIVGVVRPRADSAAASVLIDFSHDQNEWKHLPAFAERPGGPTKLLKSWLENPGALEKARVLLVPPPFHVRLTDPEIHHLERWVDGGGGLLVFGCYDERHHASNFSELAWRFDFEFGMEALVPAGYANSNSRGHVLSRDARYAVVVRPSSSHRLVDGVKELALVSAAPVWNTSVDSPELLLETSDDAIVMRPLGHIFPDGYRHSIDAWIASGKGPVPVIGARTYGRGRVIVAGTWKLCTVAAADNERFLNNAVAWLSGQ